MKLPILACAKKLKS